MRSEKGLEDAVGGEVLFLTFYWKLKSVKYSTEIFCILVTQYSQCQLLLNLQLFMSPNEHQAIGFLETDFIHFLNS